MGGFGGVRQGLGGDGYPQTYAQAHAIASKARDNYVGKKIANNTYARLWHMGAVVIVLHDTAVVTFFPDGRVKLDSGGFQTQTTRDRMRACGVDIGCAGGIVAVHWHGHSYAYRDGMTLCADGGVSGDGGVDPEEARRLRRNALARDRRSGKRVLTRWETRNASECWCEGNAPEAFVENHPKVRAGV